jgi:hypothetical protein
MSKPETLKDIIDETMRVSGVSYCLHKRTQKTCDKHQDGKIFYC